MEINREEIASAVRSITIARAQISDSISLLESNLPKIGHLDSLPKVQTINSLKRSLRAIDRMVQGAPRTIK